MSQIYRTYVGDIFCEIIVNQSFKKTIIYCPGLPDLPKDSKYLLELSMNFGYNIVYPRYRGSYESYGIFLENNPSNDILDIINYFNSTNEFQEHYNLDIINLELGEVTLLASSFGAIVALDVAKKSNNINLVLVSGMIEIDDRIEKELKFLGNFLERSYKNVYRINLNNLLSMKEKFYPDTFHTRDLDSKVVFIHGKKDSLIPIENITKKINGFDLELIELDFGHMRVSSVPIDIFKGLLK